MTSTAETLRGQVEALRIVREGWGFLTLLCGSASERATVTGHPLGVEVGDTIECAGYWTTHERFGRQFKAKEIRSIIPTDASGAVAWMCSRLPQIGRKLATEIVARWGLPGAWDVLERQPDELATLNGITPTRARAIREAYVRLLPERDRIVEFKRFGLTDRQIAKVQGAWGENALERLRKNPYALAELVDGFGFVRADAVAIRMGVDRESPARIRAGLLHVLGDAVQSGHVYVPKGALVAMAAKLLEIEGSVVARLGSQVMNDGVVAVRGVRVYPSRLDVAEAAVATSVRTLLERGAA